MKTLTRRIDRFVHWYATTFDPADKPIISFIVLFVLMSLACLGLATFFALTLPAK